MLKFLVRVFAVALLAGGLVITTYSESAAPKGANRHATVSHQPVGMEPAPACPPDDPDGCGIGPAPK